MKMGKILSVLCLCLAMTICLLCLPTTAFAYAEDSSSALVTDKTELRRGETFTVTAVLTNEEAITLATVLLQYDDSVFEMTGGQCLATGTMLGTVIPASKTGTLLYQNARVVSGNLYTFNFKVKDNASFGTVEIGNRTSIGNNTAHNITTTGLTVEVVCDHEYGNWTAVGDEHKRTCAICGDEEIEGHSFTSYESNDDATCTEDGTKTAKCDVCNVTDTVADAGSTRGHIFNNGICTGCGIETLYPDSSSLLTTDATELKRGDTFTVTAALTNHEVITLGTVVLHYDPAVFELISGQCLISNTMLGLVVKDQNAGTFLLSSGDVVNGDLFCFTMKVREDAAFGTAKISQSASIGAGVGSYIATEGVSLTVICEHKGRTFEMADDASHRAYCAICGNDELEPHIFTNYVGNGDATCLGDGTKTAKCDLCEATHTTTDTGSALGHSFTHYVSDGNATCLGDGTKTAKCDRCDGTNTVTHVGSALGHSFTHYVSDGNATCLGDGTKTAKCDRCNGTNTITNVGSALGHSFTNYTSDSNATCTEDGTETAKCNRCEITHTRVDADSKLPHTFTNYVSDGNATCTEDGTMTAQCEDCNATDTIPYEGSKLGHSFTNYISNNDFTCLQDGTETAKCDRCEITVTRLDVGSADHRYEGGFCVGCGVSERVPGDLDDTEGVTTEDVVTLLLFISMPDVFDIPEGTNADFSGDGAVTTDDAVALLLHISMPDVFPLPTGKKED